MKQYSLVLLVILIHNLPIKAGEDVYDTSWGTDGLIIGLGITNAILSSTILAEPASLTIEEINSLDRNDVNAFDRFATYNYSKSISNISDIAVASLVASPVLLLFDDRISADFLDLSLIYAEIMLWAVYIPDWSKETVGRIRPFVYFEDAAQEDKYSNDNRRSFFSGHTTVAFSAAVSLSKVYSDYYPKSKYKYYIWGASLLAASFVGGLRISSGMHFPTDVLTGAIIGSAIGYIIPEIHRINPVSGTSSLIPTPFGISFAYRF